MESFFIIIVYCIKLTNKQNKQKMIGDNYVFIGYKNDGYSSNGRVFSDKPIIVPMNSIYGGKPPYNTLWLFDKLSFSSIIISHLYKLEYVRNLDMFQFILYNCLIDSINRIILNSFQKWVEHNKLTIPENVPYVEQQQMYYTAHKDTILQIQKEYPNLFLPIFISQDHNNIPTTDSFDNNNNNDAEIGHNLKGGYRKKQTKKYHKCKTHNNCSIKTHYYR